jgi:hypothetical protein
MTRTVAVSIVATVLAGCQSMPVSGNVLAPVHVDAAPAPSSAPSPSEFDFTKDERTDEPATAEPAPLTPADQLAGMGIDGTAPATPAAPTPAPTTPAAPPAAPAEAAIVWPTTPPSSWGVRLVSTVIDAQPPLAILATADGQKLVVQPGALLPDAQVIVLAIGRDAIQVGEVIAEGDHARVETKTITAQYSASPSVNPR